MKFALFGFVVISLFLMPGASADVRPFFKKVGNTLGGILGDLKNFCQEAVPLFEELSPNLSPYSDKLSQAGAKFFGEIAEFLQNLSRLFQSSSMMMIKAAQIRRDRFNNMLLTFNPNTIQSTLDGVIQYFNETVSTQIHYFVVKIVEHRPKILAKIWTKHLEEQNENRIKTQKLIERMESDPTFKKIAAIAGYEKHSSEVCAQKSADASSRIVAKMNRTGEAFLKAYKKLKSSPNVYQCTKYIPDLTSTINCVDEANSAMEDFAIAGYCTQTEMTSVLAIELALNFVQIVACHMTATNV